MASIPQAAEGFRGVFLELGELLFDAGVLLLHTLGGGLEGLLQCIA